MSRTNTASPSIPLSEVFMLLGVYTLYWGVCTALLFGSFMDKLHPRLAWQNILPDLPYLLPQWCIGFTIALLMWSTVTNSVTVPRLVAGSVAMVSVSMCAYKLLWLGHLNTYDAIVWEFQLLVPPLAGVATGLLALEFGWRPPESEEDEVAVRYL